MNAFLLATLAATSLGLAIQYVTFTASERVLKNLQESLGLPDYIEIYDTIALGYPAYEPQPKYMRDLESMVHFNEFDESKVMSDKELDQRGARAMENVSRLLDESKDAPPILLLTAWTEKTNYSKSRDAMRPGVGFIMNTFVDVRYSNGNKMPFENGEEYIFAFYYRNGTMYWREKHSAFNWGIGPREKLVLWSYSGMIRTTPPGTHCQVIKATDDVLNATVTTNFTINP